MNLKFIRYLAGMQQTCIVGFYDIAGAGRPQSDRDDGESTAIRSGSVQLSRSEGSRGQNASPIWRSRLAQVNNVLFKKPLAVDLQIWGRPIGVNCWYVLEIFPHRNTLDVISDALLMTKKVNSDPQYATATILTDLGTLNRKIQAMKTKYTLWMSMKYSITVESLELRQQICRTDTEILIVFLIHISNSVNVL